MGQTIRFPNSPVCPPHDWVSIYDEAEGFDEEIITGRVCVKCSLIETRESLALMLAAIHGQSGLNSGGLSQGFLCVPFMKL